MSKSEAKQDKARPLGDALVELFSRFQKRGKSEETARQAIAGLTSFFAPDSLVTLGIISLLAAACGTGVLLVLNAEAREVSHQGYSTFLAVVFILLLVIYRFAQDYLVRRAAQEMEASLHHRRVRTTQDVLRLPYAEIETLRQRGQIDSLAANYSALSQTLVPLVTGAEGAVLLVFMFFYLAYISPFAAILTVIVIAIIVAGFLNSRGKLQSNLTQVARSEAAFRRLGDGLVAGSKELRLSVEKRAEVEAELASVSEKLRDGRGGAAQHFSSMLAIGNSAAYLMAGAVVFVMPILTSSDQSDIERIVVAVIFLLGPVSSVVQTIQHLTSAQFALGAIKDFEVQIDAFAADQTEDGDAQGAPEFDQLILKDVTYAHPGQSGFAIQPFEMRIRRGEIVFVTGGNGSGKTTLLRILTGLYPRQTGTIALNSVQVPLTPSQRYRNLFATVFSDFHLFPKPFGLDEEGLSRLDYWLQQLNIRDRFNDDLSVLPSDALSTGQRKRLALSVALAEARPILVLDEWAADQDPEIRKTFYDEILPRLKAQGLTIVSVTHDEQYFDRCDRRIHMVEGTLTEVSGS